MADSNAPVQEKALEALVAFLKAADADAGRYAFLFNAVEKNRQSKWLFACGYFIACFWFLKVREGSL